MDQGTGRLIWSLLSPRYMEGVKPPLHFDQWGCGICSGPVVEGERVYVVGNRGDILCLDREGQANGNGGPFEDELAFMAITNGPGRTRRRMGTFCGDSTATELDVVPHDVCGSTLLCR